MKHAIAASSLLFLAAQAKPQGPPGPGGPPGGGPPNGAGPFAAFPSCAASCWSSITDSCSSITDYTCICGDSVVNSANNCIESNCDGSDAEEVYQAVAQLCANAGVTPTAKAEATWSATSGGSAWPAGWTTSAWPSGGPWGPGSGPPGWAPGNGWGPFGQSGPGKGWGPWGSGSWTNGPWTSWWGTGACPDSTWSGWTSGPWATNAPWTTWSGCSAQTTATSVYTTTVTAGNGTVNTYTTTGYGVKLAQATGSSDDSGAASLRGGSSFGLAASAVAALGVFAGALLL